MTVFRRGVSCLTAFEHEPMQYLPVFANLRNRGCLIVGGGVVAERRVRQLLDADARVTVVAPEITGTLAEWAGAGRIEHRSGRFDATALDRFWIVVAATDDRALNRRVAAAAEAARCLCNVVDDPELCTFIMPAIIDRDPVVIAISSSGTSPVVARWIKGLIESTVPQRIGQLAALAGRWRDRVKARLPDIGQRRAFWESVLAGPVADDALTGRAEASEQALEAALEQWHRGRPGTRQVGEACLVGAGPGDPELMTLRGRRLLASADTVLYDRLVNPKILDYARRDADLISVGKQAGRPSIRQVQINRLLVELVRSGKRVCRLKGGDPMVFGRVGEELEALTAAGLPFQIVPGVSAVEGCAAYAGIPLTLRDTARAVLIATGHTKDHVAADLSNFDSGQTLALYMAVAHFGQISAQLLELGHDAGLPVAVVENGTTDRQRVIAATLGTLPETAARFEVESPALLLIGETVRYAERYAWFNSDVLRLVDADADAVPSLAQVG